MRSRIASAATRAGLGVPSGHPCVGRRDFVASLAHVGMAGALGCSRAMGDQVAGSPRLSARVTVPTIEVSPGSQPLGLGTGRDGILFVPRAYRPAEPLPLVILLHGAGGAAANWFGPFGTRADSLGLLLLAPESRAGTWDAIRGGFGADVAFLDAALRHTFARCAVDARRIAIAGFSDGASYALSLGLPNGDLFSHIIAYSPGFVRESGTAGKPRIFVSHGTGDQVLPIGPTSRSIVPPLRRRGYEVRYEEFAGGHEIPAAIATQALDWLLAA